MKVLKLKSGPDARIMVADCREGLKKIPSDTASLVFADPPYNIGVDYGVWDDSIGADKFWDFTCEWVAECARILRPDGAMFTYLPPQLANWMACLLEEEHSMHFVNDICVVQRFGQNQLNKFVSGHRRLTYHCVDLETRIWNIEAILTDSLRKTQYGDKRTMAKAEHKGQRIPLDVWGYDEPYFGRVQGGNKERRPLHPNQVPEKVLERVILATTAKGDLVVDPFAGSGTTATVARALGRRSVCCEISEKFARSAMQRIAKGPARVQTGANNEKCERDPARAGAGEKSEGGG